MSGIGKGTTTASVGRILEDWGYSVTALKADPYINVDAGTMNPIEHGEVFVTDDGLETDQDLGNYERFFNKDIPSINYMTTGSVYQTVIERERNLDYKGKCVEVVPHIPLEIIRRIKAAGRAAQADFVLIEVGGTVGEYQNMLFLEAARMLHQEDPNRVMYTLVAYLPVPNNIGEMKTKPAQTACRTLNTAGIQADIIIARSIQAVDALRREKLSVFCNIPAGQVISAPDVESIYHVPAAYEQAGLADIIFKHFRMRRKRTSKLQAWNKFTNCIDSAKKEVVIGIVGKYFKTGDYNLGDSYISVIEAIKHGAWTQGLKPRIEWIDSQQFEDSPARLSLLKKCDGVIIPQGWGARGAEGKILTARYLRENKIPYLGLCYGMQMAVIEFARNVLNLKKANSVEVDPQTHHPVIHVIEDQLKNLEIKDYGGSSRLGAYDCKIKVGSRAYRAYKKQNIKERHRHRYEFNNEYRKAFEKAGMVISGVNPQQDLVEIVEIKNHPFYIGVQFHPEYISRPLRPHPLFVNFIKVASKKKGA